MNSAEYFKVNLLFLYIVCLFLLLSYSIYGYYLAALYLFVHVPAFLVLKQGQKMMLVFAVPL